MSETTNPPMSDKTSKKARRVITMRLYPRQSESGQSEDNVKDYGRMKMLMSTTLVCTSFVVRNG
jgi:hypothetical protein